MAGNKKIKLERTIKVKLYTVISDAVAAGIVRGWNRAHKHTENPAAANVQEDIENAVLGNLCDILDFDGPPEPEDDF